MILDAAEIIHKEILSYKNHDHSNKQDAFYESGFINGLQHALSIILKKERENLKENAQ